MHTQPLIVALSDLSDVWRYLDGVIATAVASSKVEAIALCCKQTRPDSAVRSSCKAAGIVFIAHTLATGILGVIFIE